MPTPMRRPSSMHPVSRRRDGESGLRSLVMLAAILLAIHLLWPIWAPNTPRPWAGLLSRATGLVGMAVAAAPAVDRQFSGCDEARAAGYTNIPASDPSYREWMDGDGDGLACEPYRR